MIWVRSVGEVAQTSWCLKPIVIKSYLEEGRRGFIAIAIAIVIVVDVVVAIAIDIVVDIAIDIVVVIVVAVIVVICQVWKGV